jgi:hypothetical protein
LIGSNVQDYRSTVRHKTQTVGCTERLNSWRQIYLLIKFNTVKARFGDYKELTQEWLDKARAKNAAVDDEFNDDD